MSKDFRASQVETSKLIASGGISGTTLGLAIYSGSIATDRAGAVSDAAIFNDVGSDVFLFVSGSTSNSDFNRSQVSLFGGDVVISGTLYAERQVIEVDSVADGDFFVTGNMYVKPDSDSTKSVAFSKANGNDIFVVDATNSRIGVGVSDPDSTVEIFSTSTQLKLSNNADDFATFSVGTNGDLTIGTTDAAGNDDADLTLDADGKVVIEAKTGDEAVFNEGGLDVDFRVESIDETHMIFVEGSTNRVSIGDSVDSPAATLEVTNHANAGAYNVPLVQLNSNDLDQVALDINLANGHNANAVEISGEYTGKAIFVDYHTTVQSTFNQRALHIDFDKSGVVAASNTLDCVGALIEMDDSATNNASSTVRMTGLEIGVDSANSQGTTQNVGIDLNVIDADTNEGIRIKAADGTGSDIKMMSTANNNDFATIAVGANGETTITTVDDDADSAHLNLVVDGVFNVQVGGTTNFVIDSTSTVINSSRRNKDTFINGDANYGTFFLDASDESVIIGHENFDSTPAASEVPGYGADVKIMLSGSAGTKDSATRGVVLIPGDMVISGSLYDGNGNVNSATPTITGTFHIPTPTSMVTTSSVSFSGNEGFNYDPSNVGTDTHFFVSGTIGSKDTAVVGTSVFGGDVVISGSSYLLEDAYIGQNKKLLFSDLTNTQYITGSGTGGGILIDAGADLTIKNSGGTYFYVDPPGPDPITLTNQFTNESSTFNENNLNIDFRVNTQNLNNAIFVDASTDQVLILSGGSGASLNPQEFTDTNFFVSGSIGSRGTLTKGTTVFGGDVVISGTLHGGSPLKIAGGMEVTGSLTMEEGSKIVFPAGAGLTGSLQEVSAGVPYLLAGTNISLLTSSNGQVTITASGVAAGAGGANTQVIFNNSGAQSGDANFTFNSSTDTLTVTNMSGSLTQLSDGTQYIIPGTNVSTSTGSNGAITISSTDTTFTAGDGITLAGTEFSIVNATNGGVFVDTNTISLNLANLTEADVAVASDSIAIIDATDFSTKRETVADLINATAGSGLNATSGVLSVNDSIVATISGSTFTGVTKHNLGLSGSLTQLTDGTPYIIPGNNVSTSTGSNGAITISSTDTTYTAGDGLDLAGTEFSLALKSSGGLQIDATELEINDSIVATISGSTFTGDVKLGNLTLDSGGNEIDVSSGALTLDVAGNIELNADGGTIDFKDGTESLMQLTDSGITFDDDTVITATDGNLSFKATGIDHDIIFAVDDANTDVDPVLTIDGSNNGSLIHTPRNSGYLEVNDADTDGLSRLYGFGYLSFERYSDTATTAGVLGFRRSRGADGSQSAVQSGDYLGQIKFDGYDTSFVATAAEIRAVAAADHGSSGDTSDSPGKLEFYTTPDGTSTSTLAMTINSDQTIDLTDNLTIGGDSDGSDRLITFGHSTLKSVIGIDDSQDVFAINTDASFETDNDLAIDADGNVMMPNTCFVSAQLSASETNIAINTLTDVVFNTEHFDNKNAYNNTTGVFTAPVDGYYLVTVRLQLESIDTAASEYRVTVTGGDSTVKPQYMYHQFDPNFSSDTSSISQWSIGGTSMHYMDSGDTIKVTIYQSGGTQQTDIDGSATEGIGSILQIRLLG